MIRLLNSSNRQEKFFKNFDSLLSFFEDSVKDFDCSRLPDSGDLSKFDAVLIGNFIFEEIKCI